MVWQCSITYIRIKEMKNWKSEIRFRYSIWPCRPPSFWSVFFRKWPKCFRLTWGYFAVNGIQEKALAQAQSRQLGTWEGCKQQQDRRINVQGRPWGERRALSFQLIISLSHLIACIWLLCAMHSSSTSPLLNTHIKDIRCGFNWNCATIISLSWFNIHEQLGCRRSLVVLRIIETASSDVKIEDNYHSR